MDLNSNVKFKKEPILEIVGEPTVWSEDYEMDPLKFIREWGAEMEGPFENPVLLVVLPQIFASQQPSTFEVNIHPSQAPTSDIPPVSTSDATTTPPPHNADVIIQGLQHELKDYKIDHQMLTIVDLKNELMESLLQLEEADNMIDSLYHQMDELEDKWIARMESLKWKMEDDRATMVPLALIEDTPPTTSEEQTKSTSPIIRGEEGETRHKL
ncbi:hypothetical protein Dimus_029559 [Dionaea muscipula]